MTTLNINLQGLCGDITAVVHVGNLETIVTVSISDLPELAQASILNILSNHLNHIDTSKLLALLQGE